MTVRSAVETTTGQRQAMARRDRAIAAATKALDRAHGLILDAMRHDEELRLVDKVGSMTLAQAADDCTTSQRRMQYGQDHARQRRRDQDRQTAAEQEVRT